MKKIIISVILALLVWACTPQKAPQEAHENHDAHEENTDVQLNATQIKTIGLAYGTFEALKVSNYIKTNGLLDLPPNNIVSIHAPQAGFVENSSYLVGDKIQKGAVLTTLSHPSYIQLQQKYLDSYSQFQFLEKELARQKELREVNANSEKKLQEIEANYFSALSSKNALEEQLKFMGISIENLKKGKITSKITIKAPITGFITKMNIHKGLYVQPEIPMFEIVDNEHMHLELQVFEKDLFKVKKEQKISFTLPTIGNKIYEGSVYLIGQSFDNETKTIQVHGHLDKENPQFIKGLFVEAKIWLDEITVNALPSEAVIQEKGKAYIFVKKEHSHDKGHSHEHGTSEKTSFARIEVKIIAEENDFIGIEVLDKIEKNAKIVTKGAFYLTSESRKAEAGHGHEH